MNKLQKKTLTILSATMSLALTYGASGAMAGVVDNNNNSAPLGACGAANAADTVSCVGAWNLDNVQVDLIHLIDGSTFGTFDPTTGSYTQMVVGDSFVSKVYSGLALTAKVSGKVWPVGEPTAIKAVNNDTAVKNGKPKNCLINTSYLDSTDTGDVNAAYLNTANPQPVICSSPFQSHKRFKVAMQPATTAGVTSGDGQQPIDLVFNTTDNATVTSYEVFSKINNYTDKRLSGYKIEVGVGTGSGFKTATDLGISDQLYLSLGIGEGTTGNTTPPTYSDMFDSDGLATFSHGLFGGIDPNFTTTGFFSNTTAYYPVSAQCSTAAGVTVTCPNTRVVGTGVTVDDSDTVFSSGPLSTNYTHLFGEWLPSIWEPKGIFFDFDSNPSTDPKLVAWWNGTQWLMPSTDASGNPVYDANGYAVFVPVPQTEFNTWASDSRYSIDVIEDVLNLGINYIVHVGDINTAQGSLGFSGSTNFTVRIIPVVAADQTAPAWVGTTPAPLVVPSSGSGGGCTIGGDGHFDPIFPALLLASLGFFGLRRFSRKS